MHLMDPKAITIRTTWLHSESGILYVVYMIIVGSQRPHAGWYENNWNFVPIPTCRSNEQKKMVLIMVKIQSVYKR